MSVAIIPDFVKYQIEWLTSHKDLEFEPVIEDAIVKMLKDTGKSFIDEQHAETSQFDHTADIGKKVDGDCISRQAAIDAALEDVSDKRTHEFNAGAIRAVNRIKSLPSAQPKRKWTPCSNPPKHHRDVLVRGIEAIGNATVHKVMQWDVDTWRPTDYAPSIIWKEWSEI